MFYNRTREAKKAEFLKAGKDHRGKKVTSEQDAGIAAYLYAEEDVHNRIKASGMYLEIYAELVKLVFDRAIDPGADLAIPMARSSQSRMASWVGRTPWMDSWILPEPQE